MAVTGLHNVSMLDCSFLRESQSPGARQWNSQDETGTRASSVLQMWRELESEHEMRSQPSVTYVERTRSAESSVDFASNYSFERPGSDDAGFLDNANVIDNGCQTCPQTGAQLDNEDVHSSNSDLSTDLSEGERERVRQIFQEWMNSGARGHATNDSYINNYSRAQWLGENERERVRIIREWVQMTSQKRGPCGGSEEEQAAAVGSQIEQVRNGFTCETGARKAIRRLCGRQTLLDLLMRAERERKKELQYLQESHPVSGFAHRNRIQALLRGRFLRNESVQGDKTMSNAASELGLLRQRNTVSGLREEFLSRLDSFANGSVGNSHSDASCSADNNDHGTEQSQQSRQPSVVNETSTQSEPYAGENEITELHTDYTHSSMDQDSKRFNSILEDERPEQVQVVNEREQSVSSIFMIADGRDTNDSENAEEIPLPSSVVNCVDRREEERNYVNVNSRGRVVIEQMEEISVVESSGQGATIEAHQGMCDRGGDERNHMDGNSQGRIVVEQMEEISVAESSGQGVTYEARDGFHERFATTSDASDLDETSHHINSSRRNTTYHFDWQDTSAQSEWQELVLEDGWQQYSSVEFNGQTDHMVEDNGGNRLEGDDNQWHEGASGDLVVENNHMHESHDTWNGNNLQEALDNWLDGHSSQESSPIQRPNSFYFSDDDNVYNMELRELSRRRRVSNLLQSGFRENLDRLIQSYVERQAHASVDWEVEERSQSLASEEQDDQQQTVVQNTNQSDVVEETALVLPSQPATPVDPRWNHSLHGASWPQPNVHMQCGIEWDVINELRIDVAQLQQRMNNMQRMLEACMDMQLELQRAVRQEVSAALNRSTGTPDLWGMSLQMDESKWDHVRKGLCCICCDSKINSLLYRCGHMCTCSKCAEKIVQGKGKCPMCLAPVVEVIRAYSI